MKYPLAAFLLLTALTPAKAQPKHLYISNSITIRLEHAERKDSLAAGPFSHFGVIDARPDTGQLGIHADRYKIGIPRNQQLVLPVPASTGIAAYLNERFAAPGGGFTALVVLRTLWLSDANNTHEDMVKDAGLIGDRTKIRLKAEVYAVKDGVYVPLFRYDSVQVSQKGTYSRFGKDLSEMLNGLADSSQILVFKKWGVGRRLSLDEIRRFNQSRLDLPVVRDSILTEGVYANFEEFRDDAPSIHDYELKKEQNKLVLYLKDKDGHPYYSHNAWGYCDGKNIYVMKEGMLEPAWKEGKAWYFLSGTEAGIDPSDQNSGGYPGPTTGAGLRSTAAPAGIYGVGVMTGIGLVSSMVNKGPNRVNHLFTVDMDTGNAY